jgi:transposase
VPSRLVGAGVTVRLTATMLEILHQGTRVAAHARSALKGRYTTEPTHRPKSHQQHLEWSPSRLVAWGASIGDATARVVTTILARQPHPEQGYRACLGLLSLSRRYARPRLDAASVRALASGAVSYRAVKSILATGLDHLPLEAEPPTLHLPATHAHVRGAAYYQTCLTLDATSADLSAVEPDVLTLCGEPAC